MPQNLEAHHNFLSVIENDASGGKHGVGNYGFVAVFVAKQAVDGVI